SRPASTSPPRSAAAASPSPIRRRSPRASTRRRRSCRFTPGTRSGIASHRRRTCARPSPSSRAARRRSASSIAPTRSRTRACAWWRPFPRRAIRRWSIRWWSSRARTPRPIPSPKRSPPRRPSAYGSITDSARFREAMPTREELDVVLLSLKVAAWGVAASLPIAVATAFVLARKRFPGKMLFDAAVHLPLVLPPVVVGFALLVLFGRHGPLGRLLAPLGIVFAFRWTGAALAAAVMGFPLMVRAIRLAIDAVDARLELAARTLGASRMRVFFTVTLPLAWPGLVTGALLAFARSLGEFGATITFVSNIPGETRTLPLAIYTFTQSPGEDAQALRLSILSVCLSLAALAASEWLARRPPTARRDA